MSLRTKVLSGFLWGGGTRIIAHAVSWAITLVVIRILSPADYGLLAMATVFVEFFGMMSQFGVGSAVVQAPELDETKQRQMFGFGLMVNSALCAILFLGAQFIAAFFAEPRLTAIVQVLALGFLLSPFGLIPSAMLARRLDYKTGSVIGLFSSAIGSVTTLALALAGVGVWALVWGNLAGAIWNIAVLNILFFRQFRMPIFSIRGTRDMVMFGGNVTVTRILWFWYSQADVIIAGRLLGKDLLGVYSVAMHLANLPAAKLSALVNQVAFPAFASIQHDRERYAAHFLLAVRLLSFLVFPALWGMSSVAPELVRVVLGSKWEDAVMPLQLLALIMPVHMFAPFMNTAATGMGRADVSAKQVLTAVMVMPVAFYVGVQWGLVGLALSWVIAFPLVFAVAIRLFVPIVALRARDILGAMAPAMVACSGMYLVVTGVRAAFGHAMTDIALLTMLVLSGAAAYAGFTAIFNRAGVREIIKTLKG